MKKENFSDAQQSNFDQSRTILKQNYRPIGILPRVASISERFLVTIQSYRLYFRSKLKLQPLNIITFLSLFPFFIGFWSFVQQKYPFQKTYIFFEKNLPGISIPTEKINWDTFQYILKEKPFFQTPANNIYWSERNVILQKNRQSGTTEYEFIASIPSSRSSLFGPSVLAENDLGPSWPKATDHSIKFSKEGFGAPRYVFILKQSPARLSIRKQVLVLQNTLQAFYDYYFNLDEIPSKLQSNYSNTTKKWDQKSFPFSSFDKKGGSWHKSFLSTEIWNGSSTLSQNFVNTQQSLTFLSGVHTSSQVSRSWPIAMESVYGSNQVFPSRTKKILQILNQNCNPSGTNLYAYDKQQKITNKWHAFEIEIRKLFTNTGLIPNLTDGESAIISLQPNLIRQLTKYSINLDDLKTLQNLLYSIDVISIPKELSFTRLMSGYKYPDMSFDEVCWLIIHQNFSNSLNIKILLPPSYAIANTFYPEKFEVPEFLIHTKNLTFKNPHDQEVFYEGPGLILNPKNGLDWELDYNKNAHTHSFRSWLETYLGADNPFSDTLTNFFGNFQSPEFASATSQLDTRSLAQSSSVSSYVTKKLNKDFEKDYWLKNLPVFRNGIITHTTYSHIPFERSFQVPALSAPDWENYCENVLSNSDGLTTQFSEISLPILETRLPTGQLPRLGFGLDTLVDYSFSQPIQKEDHAFRMKGPKGRVESNFLPAVSSFLNEESFGTQFSSGIYQKVTSLFEKDSNVFFYDLWEPLTFRSWLVISQVGFAFLVFRILKALADNYGRELLVYLLDLVALLGFLDEDLKQEIEILMGQREKGFRIISKTTKTFSDIAGIQKLLPEVVEIVWFLRNSGKEFSLSKTLPRGVLLTGPPGTGKTLLVQALAGEAEVPVLALSGSSLLEPGESGALKLEILFQEARRLAPCIVFIDEMDTLAQKREQVLQNPMGADEVIESLHDITRRGSEDLTPGKVGVNTFSEESNNLTETILSHQDTQREKLRILMQFLVELDGIQGRDGVVVIGATNRPEMLDAAIVRPGRFDRVLELGLPGPEKRQDILKLYSQNLGTEQTISWNYLTHRTAGYSAADLASIMNQSSLKAIMLDSPHTIETIEHGIDRITTIGFETPPQTIKNSLSTLRLAYYQAGKILLSRLLEHHPPTLVMHLWPRRTNVRALQITANLQKYFFRFARRIELEHRIIGCYAGKAAEILLLQNSSSESNLSDLGVEDIQFAQNLIEWMVEKWYLYSKTIAIQSLTALPSTKNTKEYRDTPEKIPFFNQLLDTVESPTSHEVLGYGTGTASTDLLPSQEMNIALDQQSQSYFPLPCWQYQISSEFEIATRNFSDWYRLYLPDPQENERNLEWSPPDEFYHGNSLLDELTPSTNWNDVPEISSDYQKHSLILQSFNKALVLLDQHREILDKLAYELIHREILREPEIDKIFQQFGFDAKNLPRSAMKGPLAPTQPPTAKEKQTVLYSWGRNSRRKNTRSVNIEELSNDK